MWQACEISQSGNLLEDFPEDSRAHGELSMHDSKGFPEHERPERQRRSGSFRDIKGSIVKSLKNHMPFLQMEDLSHEEAQKNMGTDESCRLCENDMVVYSPGNERHSDFFDNNSFTIVDGLITLTHSI
uniref:Uncharacterized protein n=1 Tax=Trieres chinensis TaxID=1514140 RepID=A0A7S1ZU51_TRICV|mmetsp:Transcript_32887/g.67112  ORF Transcript_32887/g.67112 Transcript_32887/m.67112 type:complete len:128 (+) Transcript_32887:1-384(+)